MKIFRIIKKSFKDAFKSVYRNLSLSMASISCTAITLILVAIALLTTYNVNSITKDIEDVLTIVVFVDKDATQTEINVVENSINEIKNVDESKTQYDSKEEIKETLSKDEDIKPILDILDTNPIPSAFIVSVKDVKKITETANDIKKIENVTKVKYGESLVNKLISMLEIVRIACVVAVAVLIFVTGFLISNTIKITIFSRRHEIDIMRLVGTSNTAIKLPFLFEGFTLGIIGSIIPIIVTIYGYIIVYDRVDGYLFSQMIELVKPFNFVFYVAIVLLVIGSVVGMFASFRAVRKYLKI